MKRAWLLAKRFWDSAATAEDDEEGMEAERDRREESRDGLACLRRLAGREERREAAGIAAAGAEVRRKEQIAVGMAGAGEAASSSRRHCEWRWLISRARVRTQAARRRSWVGIDGMVRRAGSPSMLVPWKLSRAAGAETGVRMRFRGVVRWEIYFLSTSPSTVNSTSSRT